MARAFGVLVLFLVAAQGAAYSADKADFDKADLDEVCALLTSRDSKISKLSYAGRISYFGVPLLSRNEGESDDALIERHVNSKRHFTPVSFQFAVARDYRDESLYARAGEPSKKIPKYEEFLRLGDYSVNLTGLPGKDLNATIGGDVPPSFTNAATGVRVDRRVLRPIGDLSLATVLRESSLDETPDPYQRGPLVLSRSSDGWTAILKTLHPSKSVTGNLAYKINRHRIDLEKQGGDLVLSRVDNLSAVPRKDALPRLVTFIDDYRDVDGIFLPHRIVHFMFSNQSVRGALVEVESCHVNDKVLIPKDIDLPSGTYVFDRIKATKSRVGMTRIELNDKVGGTAQGLQAQAQFESSNTRMVLIIVNIFVFIVILGVVIFRKLRS